MKKIFLFAALAGIVFASCQKEASVAIVAQNDGQQEVTFAAFSKAMTKGVLGGGTFATDRKIQVAGVMKTADGQYVDFLDSTNFAKDGTTDIWKASPAVYYPMGVKGEDFTFLAYSETPLIDAASGDIKEATFARWYGSSQVELMVTDKSARNEIVYAGFKGDKNQPAAAAFHRSQALVTVYIHPASGDAGKIKINKIGFKDVKTSGTLLLTINPKSASSDAGVKHQWLFNAGCNCAFAEMGNYNLGETVSGDASGDATEWVSNATITADVETYFREVVASASGDCLKQKLTNGFFLDRLFPAQELETKKMVINYTLGGITTDVELALEDAKWATSDKKVIKWQAGTRYVYNIKVNVGEILINPQSPAGWEINTIQGVYDPEPSDIGFGDDYGDGGEF